MEAFIGCLFLIGLGLFISSASPAVRWQGEFDKVGRIGLWVMAIVAAVALSGIIVAKLAT